MEGTQQVSIKDYQIISLGTRSRVYTEGTQIEAVTLDLIGLGSEGSEFLAAPSRDELGDVIWYHSNLCDLIRKPLQDVYDEAFSIIEDGVLHAFPAEQELVFRIGRLHSLVKKSIEKQKPWDDDKMHNLVVEVAIYIVFNARALGTTVEQIMNANVAKLQARHGVNNFNADHI